jgi:two-component system, response regulator PdtaR
MEAARILLVDDDRLICATLSEGLRHQGYEVETANSGEQALALCEQMAPHLAILDMRMSGMTGVETARFLRQRTRVPYLFLSAYGDSETVKEAVAEGALGYLVKPVDIGQLIPAVEAALARATDIDGLRQNEQHLQAALSQNREASIAVGILMERFRFDREQAFAVLRYQARSQRRKLQDVASGVVESAERLSLPPDILEKIALHPKSE